MVSRQDIEKRRAWESRFEQFRASGLSIARFCKRQRLSVHTFYYWAKRVGAKSARSSGRGQSPRRNGSHMKSSAATCPTAGSALVRFSWHAGVEVSVPADCLSAIRCLVESIERARGRQTDVFQELVVRS